MIRRGFPVLFPALVALIIVLVAGCSASDPTAVSDEQGAGAVDVDAFADSDDSAGADEATPAEAGADADAAGEQSDTSPSDEPSTDDAPDVVAADFDPVVFDANFGETIQPMIAESCAGCHNADGAGSPHWQLETVADIQANHQALAGVVQIGYMPPWPAGGESIPHQNDRRLRPDQIEAILAWSDAGGEIDVPAETAVTAPEGILQLEDVDVVLEPGEFYDGTVGVLDDYRCNIYDPGWTEDGWIEGYAFVPDQTEIVHHAIGYILPAKAMEDALAAQAEDPEAGWSCFGSSGLPYNDPIFLGWAPGQDPTQFPEGSGLRIEAGEFLVLQIHYHNEVDTPPDVSTLELALADPSADLVEVQQAEYIAPVEIPCTSDETGPLCDRDAAYADAIKRFGEEGVRSDQFNAICGTHHSVFADDTDGKVSSSCDLPIYEFGELISVLGHEHEIGTSFKMTLNPDTDDAKVLLDIPVWDFDWQLNYAPTEQIVLQPGDQVRIECSWDRALLDPGLEPRYILWADGTNDEMCFSTITTRALS